MHATTRNGIRYHSSSGSSSDSDTDTCFSASPTHVHRRPHNPRTYTTRTTVPEEAGYFESRLHSAPALNGAAMHSPLHGFANGYSTTDTEEDSDPDSHSMVARNASTRHGLDHDEQMLLELETRFSNFWSEPRHDNAAVHDATKLNLGPLDWRPKDRMKVAGAIIVVCLRLGYDPPDVVRTSPCARVEAWVDPTALTKEKALEQIGLNLQKQYENLASNSKAKYQTFLDPFADELKKQVVALRKRCRGERALFHYNGHGVPKPTPGGEIWVFNKAYTQYIPISTNDLVQWIGGPSIYIWDCAAAENVIKKVIDFSNHNARAQQQAAASAGPGNYQEIPHLTPAALADTIQLGACLANETLPMNPNLPADLFTSCLTSPIEMAIKFFLLHNPLKSNIPIDIAIKIPGRTADRKTPLGELQWIFTAVTDTIAWNVLSKETFQRLFRHDLVVAALFRGFLLAERIMKHYDCTPVSVPALPACYNHPLWESWDLAVDRCISQIPGLLEYEKQRKVAEETGAVLPQPVTYLPSLFFTDQLTSFSVWIEQGTARTVPPDFIRAPRRIPGTRTTLSDLRNIRPIAKHPEQLPVLLQVLLSQAHRLRALILLCKFLDLGPWAVNLGLSIGIFPYVLKLFQAPGPELRPVLVYIWARILAIFRTCQEELTKPTAAAGRPNQYPETPFHYFASVLDPAITLQQIPNVTEHRAMAAFNISIVCRGFRPGQENALTLRPPNHHTVFESCILNLLDPDPLLRQWSALCIAQAWNRCDDIKGKAVHGGVHSNLAGLVGHDSSPETRAALIYALSTFLGSAGTPPASKSLGRSLACSNPQVTGLSEERQYDEELGVAMATLVCLCDGSPVVRKELCVLLSALVSEYIGSFIAAAYHNAIEDIERQSSAALNDRHNISARAEERKAAIRRALEAGENATQVAEFRASIFMCLYKGLLDLSVDPYPQVAQRARKIVDFINSKMLDSGLPLERVLGHFTSSTTSSTTVPTLSNPFASSVSSQRSIYPASASAAQTTFAPSIRRASGLVGAASSIDLPSQMASSQRSVHQSNSADSLLQSQARTLAETVSDLQSFENDREEAEKLLQQLMKSDYERQRRKRMTSDLAHPTREEIESPMPLKSDFYDWCTEYFAVPQMKTPEAEEPGSMNYNERHWRRERNGKIIERTQPLKEAAGSSRWDEQTALWENSSPPLRLCFHQFEPHCIAADETGHITTYNWSTRDRLGRFYNGSARPSRHSRKAQITTLKLVNEDDKAYLLVGSADGIVRLWDDYTTSRPRLVTAYRALKDIIPTTIQESGLIADWQQTRGRLLAGGNSSVIRIWDASKEMSTQEILTRASSCLTSITSDQTAGDIVIGGFGDGSIRVYDTRLSSRETQTQCWRGYHKSWILNCHMQRGGGRELVSGSTTGDIKMWDIRMASPIKAFQAHGAGMSTLAIHEHAPVFATGSDNQVVKIWNMASAEPFCRFRQSTGYSTRGPVPPLTSMMFHPHEMMLAVGSQDAHLNIFSCQVGNKRA